MRAKTFRKVSAWWLEYRSGIGNVIGRYQGEARRDKHGQFNFVVPVEHFWAFDMRTVPPVLLKSGLPAKFMRTNGADMPTAYSLIRGGAVFQTDNNELIFHGAE